MSGTWSQIERQSHPDKLLWVHCVHPLQVHPLEAQESGIGCCSSFKEELPITIGQLRLLFAILDVLGVYSRHHVKVRVRLCQPLHSSYLENDYPRDIRCPLDMRVSEEIYLLEKKVPQRQRSTWP